MPIQEWAHVGMLVALEAHVLVDVELKCKAVFQERAEDNSEVVIKTDKALVKQFI